MYCRPPVMFPKTVRVEIHGLSKVYTSSLAFPCNLLTYAFAIPGVAGIFWLKVSHWVGENTHPCLYCMHANLQQRTCNFT